MSIKELREKANLSQEEMAIRLFTTPATIRDWENGTKRPFVGNMPQIANVLGVELKDVVDAFAPSDTKYNRDFVKYLETRRILARLFFQTHHVEMFFALVKVLDSFGTKGMILSDSQAFAFNRIVMDHPEDVNNTTSIILTDNNNNRVLLSKKRIIQIYPRSMGDDTYNYEIIVDYPIFDSKPVAENKYSYRLVFYFDDGEKY